ncbi:MAG: TonB-dependent receptor [Salinivirgaceae bacterium]|nr:TonB-dependent receptor [Salinivirgaceae bacterium]
MKKIIWLLGICALTAKTAVPQQLAVAIPHGKHTVSGIVSDAATGEELIGAAVYIKELGAGTTTNTYGFYSLTVADGDYELVAQFIGYTPVTKKISLSQNIKVNFSLETTSTEIAQVDVKGEKLNKNLTRPDMGMEKLQISTIKSIPALFGETDVIKSIQFLPGVGTSGEGFIGYNVRGGGTGQNMMLLDEATVYNAAHLFGIFSVFNNDALKDVKFYKGGMPAEYGGRLSSLLDVHMKEGSPQKFGVNGGIGLLSSRLTIDGPILKDRCSFIVSGRRSYMDIFFPLYRDEIPDDTKLYFYDMNAKVNFKVNDNNRLFASGYFGRDVMNYAGAMQIDYGNRTLTTRYNHLFSDRLFSNLSVIYSHFMYGLEESDTRWESSIRDWNAKADVTFFATPQNTLKTGGQLTYHKFTPFIVKAGANSPNYMKNVSQHNNSLEYAAYVTHETKIGGIIDVDYGLRLSMFQNFGKAEVVNLDENYNAVDTTRHTKGVFNTYKGLEPRISVNWRLTDKASLKANFQQTYQYVHLASNTMSPLPIDSWFASNPNVKPERCRMVSLGYFQNTQNDMYAFSAETYYKKMYDVVDFKDHADMFVSDDIATQIRTGQGYSYGLELMLKKQEGKFTGWISYTYSRTFTKVATINNDEYYPSNYDKPHDLSVVATYDVLPRLHLSLNWVYSTGAPRTLPTGRFEYNGVIAPVYAERNKLRLPDFHRLDLSATFDLKTVERKGRPWLEQNLNLSIYNVYNRHNAASIMFEQDEHDPSVMTAEKLYMFSIFPSVTYNFKF